MGAVNKEMAIGVLVSIIATLGGGFIYLEFFSEVDFEASLKIINDQHLYGKMLTLAAIPNLFVFFVFLKKKQDYRARGVLLATILIAFTTFVLKVVY
ncbi:MAG: hypothetical protein P8K77_00645 [Polaribacter sp.]|nr:hypothetical protein [Polaribacter sp.]